MGTLGPGRLLSWAALVAVVAGQHGTIFKQVCEQAQTCCNALEDKNCYSEQPLKCMMCADKHKGAMHGAGCNLKSLKSLCGFDCRLSAWECDPCPTFCGEQDPTTQCHREVIQSQFAGGGCNYDLLKTKICPFVPCITPAPTLKPTTAAPTPLPLQNCGSALHAMRCSLLEPQSCLQCAVRYHSTLTKAKCTVDKIKQNCGFACELSQWQCTDCPACTQKAGLTKSCSRRVIHRAAPGGSCPKDMRKEVTCPFVSCAPTRIPTLSPTPAPTIYPTPGPTSDPTKVPPSYTPTTSPTPWPTTVPSPAPTKFPTLDPTRSPTITPTKSPVLPTPHPTLMPTFPLPPTPQPPYWDASATKDEQTNRVVQFKVPKDVEKGCEYWGTKKVHFKQDTGYIEVDKDKGKHFFYWFVQSLRDKNKDPVILFLSGGRGCSAMANLLTENGPCLVTRSKLKVENKYTLAKFANVIWLDQPYGVGFSYKTKTDKETASSTMGADSMEVFRFLQMWFKTHPKFANHDFYIMAEHESGRYVPVLSDMIVKSNKAYQKRVAARISEEQEQREGMTYGEVKNEAKAKKGKGLFGNFINLKGIIMGATDLNPVAMVNSYVPYLKKSQYFKNTHYAAYLKSQKLALKPGVIKLISQASSVCFELAKKCQHTTSQCKSAHSVCRRVFFEPLRQANIDEFDIMKHCDRDVHPLCFDASGLREYLITNRKQLGISDKSSGWESCNPVVGARFSTERMKDVSFLLPDLLDNGVQILMYSLDYDYTANWMGQLMTIANLKWPGKSTFFKPADQFKGLLNGTLHFGASEKSSLTLLRMEGDTANLAQAAELDRRTDRKINMFVGSWLDAAGKAKLNAFGDWISKELLEDKRKIDEHIT